MTREEAIMAVKEVAGMSLPWNDRHYEALQMAVKALEEPERKTGRWIDAVDNGWRCTACGMRQTYGKPRYCPACGAKMEGNT